jgi:hypothetical protein
LRRFFFLPNVHRPRSSHPHLGLRRARLFAHFRYAAEQEQRNAMHRDAEVQRSDAMCELVNDDRRK